MRKTILILSIAAAVASALAAIQRYNLAKRERDVAAS